MRRNQGLIEDLVGPGARPSITYLKRWYCRDVDLVFWDPEGGMCRSAALIHAINAVQKRSFGLCYREAMQKSKHAINSLSTFARLAMQMKNLVPSNDSERVVINALKKCGTRGYANTFFTYFADKRRRLVWKQNDIFWSLLSNVNSFWLSSGIISTGVKLKVKEVVKQFEKKIKSALKFIYLA